MKTEKNYNRYIYVFIWCAFFIAAFSVCCLIGYSDGDDANFIAEIQGHSLIEYCTLLYRVWTGRIVSMGLEWIFHQDNLFAWRVFNALTLTACAYLFTRFTRTDLKYGFLPILLAGSFFLLADINTIGYACIWVAGSVVYLFPAVTGLVALLYVYRVYSGQTVSILFLIGATICSILTIFSQEQMGLVVVCFEIIALIACFAKGKDHRKELIILTAVSIISLVIVFIAPGNQSRIRISQEIYLPALKSLSVPKHIFMTAQWLLSSFGNENALLLAAVLICRLLGRKTFKILDGAAVIMVVTLILAAFGYFPLSDMGLNLSSMRGLVEKIPEISDLTSIQLSGMVWSSVALIFTFVYIGPFKDHDTIVLRWVYLAAIASEAIMYFSPTIYESGERVFFVADVLLFAMIMLMSRKLSDRRFTCCALIMGVM